MMNWNRSRAPAKGRVIALAVVVLFVALVGLACGQKGAAAPTATPKEAAPQKPVEAAAPSQAPSQAAAPAPARATAPVPKGGVFRALWSDPPTLDPHLAADTTSAGLIVEIFSGLVTIAPDDLTLKPDIAERWDIGGNGTVYTFYLRKDAKFHDGRAVTARDFKYSLERATDPKLLSPVADTYLGEIVGARDKINGRATEVAGVRVIDDHTLQITTARPTAYFLAMLTYPTAFVVDQANIERLGRRWTSQPNGTGAFRLKEYRIGELLVLERNEHYHRGPANLDRIEYILAGGSAMAMYENNEIDITGVGLADLDRVRDPSEPLNKEVQVAPPGFDIYYIGFNVNAPPFDDLKVRQALNHAVNKDFLAKQVLNSLVVPAYGVLPPGFPGYTGKSEGLKFDPNKARRLMAESRYAAPEAKRLLAEFEQAPPARAEQLLAEFKRAVTAKLPRIVLTVPGTGGGLGIDLEVITEMWRQILGVQPEFQQVEWATFLQDLNKKRFQMFAGLGWQADYPDPQNFLDILFHSRSDINHGAYANAQVDGLLEQARSEQDWNRRVVLYQQAEQMVLDDAAWVPLWFTTDAVVLLKPHVKRYRLTPLIVPKMQEVYMEKRAGTN